MSTLKHPSGIPFIIANEVAERFSYYGMKAILVVFMTTLLLDRSGAPAPMSKEDATVWYHLFSMTNYLVPIFGAVIADVFWGKYKTIILLSLVYCIGHVALACDDTRYGLLLGLSLIAIGSGGIKPCVSAHLGDQYRYYGSEKLSQGYSLFYFGINVGACVSTLLTPWLLHAYGPRIAFAVPGLCMGAATIFFWLGRQRYITLPPTPWRLYVSELRSPEGKRHLALLAVVFASLSIFWSLFDQTGSSWVFQAERMDREISGPFGSEIILLPSQIQAVNPVLILILTPTFSWLVYPALARRKMLSTAGKLVSGVLIAALSFVFVAIAQAKLSSGLSVSVGWQMGSYVLLTVAEVMVSITALEMAYTHAPPVSKSFVTSFYLLSVALGNGVTALSAEILGLLSYTPETPHYFGFFAALAFASVAPLVWSLSRLR